MRADNVWGSVLGNIFCGLDGGKQSVSACAADEKPPNLKRFAETYKVKVYRSTLADLQKLAQVADIYFIEPTGLYYRIFVEYLRNAGKTVLLVPSRLVRSYCEYHGLLNKSDRIDPAGILGYGIERLRDPRAFIEIHTQDLREVCSKLRSLQQQKQGIQGLLGQRLCLEVPEWVKTYEDSDRDWLDPDPPALWRCIAGEKVYNQKRRDREMGETHGKGLSTASRRLATQLVTYERWERDLEEELNELLFVPEFERYHQSFDKWKVANKIRGQLLTVIHPFDRFLVDGKPEVIRVIGIESQRKSKLTKRNKSLDAFRLYNGLGTVIADSGTVKKRVAGGSAYIRSQWWQLVKTSVVMRRPRTLGPWLEKLKQDYCGSKQAWLNGAIVEEVATKFEITPELSEAWIHYQELKITKPIDDMRIMLVAKRIAKKLFFSLCESL